MDAVENIVTELLSVSVPVKSQIPASHMSHHAKLKSLAVAARRPELLGADAEEKALIHQWIESTVQHLSCSNERALAEHLDGCLSTRVFVLSQRLTLADLILFAALHPLFLTLTFHEKERLGNASRWFSHVQEKFRGDADGNKFALTDVAFVRNKLYQLRL